MNIKYIQAKKEALKSFGVTPMEDFDVKKAVRDRIDYLKNFVKDTKRKAIVLGISGGVDSFTAGKMSQIAISELRDEGYDAKFIAMRLPYNVQKDEDDAQLSLKYINPDVVLDVNIGSGTDSISNAVASSLFNSDLEKSKNSFDFVKGNVKARMRMIAQYQVAGLYDGLVLGTDHNAEGFLSFYTYH